MTAAPFRDIITVERKVLILNLTNQQLKILKFIIKPRTVKDICDRFNFQRYEDFQYLLIYNNQPLFEWESEPIMPDTHLQASLLATSYIESIKHSNIHFIITTSISLFALITSVASFIVSIQ